jgi:hypothetical protein
MQVLDPDARVYLWRHFLSDEECDFIKLKVMPMTLHSVLVAPRAFCAQ